ncbi:hypothetical protein AB0F52_20845 [Amycolatopsis sp. NPDC024027]|uniref:hypothetical protein n=1 Tax=Amycolatopsis sp. NPDC024027 TaxID=3154327 RepID=UPI0033DF32A2
MSARTLAKSSGSGARSLARRHLGPLRPHRSGLAPRLRRGPARRHLPGFGLSRGQRHCRQFVGVR